MSNKRIKRPTDSWLDTIIIVFIIIVIALGGLSALAMELYFK